MLQRVKRNVPIKNYFSIIIVYDWLLLLYTRKLWALRYQRPIARVWRERNEKLERTARYYAKTTSYGGYDNYCSRSFRINKHL